jgi:hypothetical protein
LFYANNEAALENCREEARRTATAAHFNRLLRSGQANQAQREKDVQYLPPETSLFQSSSLSCAAFTPRRVRLTVSGAAAKSAHMLRQSRERAASAVAAMSPLRQRPQPQQLKAHFGRFAQQVSEGVARSAQNIPGSAAMASLSSSSSSSSLSASAPLSNNNKAPAPKLVKVGRF